MSQHEFDAYLALLGGMLGLSPYVIQPPDILGVDLLEAVPLQPYRSVTGKEQFGLKLLVGPDGRINLGDFGTVYVAGMTIAQAKEAIEEKLSSKMADPEVVVDVHSYNSRVYYVIMQGKASGDSATRLPLTGKETVLDAIAQIGCDLEVSKQTMWISRPVPGNNTVPQILTIDWEAIMTAGDSSTNYGLLPGDRLFIQSEDASSPYYSDAYQPSSTNSPENVQ